MSQTGHGDLEGGSESVVDSHSDQNRSTPNQSFWTSSEELEPEFRDSAWPLYSIYSNIAEDEINKMIERCQRNTDGTLIFTGLFSATVGALLTVSIPDLKPNSQDTSAFYLKNIYQLFGNTNISNPLISSSSNLAEPPAFSPPKYAIWVNSLWFLSLALSLSCAIQAMMNRKGAVDYFEFTRLPWYTPVQRARIRAFFAKGNPGPYTIFGTDDYGVYLHFSLILFIIGGLIYLFNINHAVFYAVVWWVVLMAGSYTEATAGIFFKPHNLFHTPLSPLALRIFLGIFYVVFQVCSYIPRLHGLSDNTRRRYYDLKRYSVGILLERLRAAHEIASKPSSEIDTLIMERILLTLDEDCALEVFLDTIPGFCRSKLSISPLPFPIQTKLGPALDGFLDHTFSSSLVSESVRASRLITCLNAAHAALEPGMVSQILGDIINRRWIEALQSVEIGHALRLWGNRRDHEPDVRRIMACIIACAQRRDDPWTMLVKEAFGVPDGVLQDSLTHGDSVLLAILIHISRQFNSSGFWMSGILSSLSKFDICNTLPGLQDDFRILWNEITQPRNQGSSNIPAQILGEIGHLYISLNQGSSAAPTAFSTSTDSLDSILDQPSLHPLGDISDHQQSSTIYTPVAGPLILTGLNQTPAASPPHSPVESDHSRDGSITSQIIEEANIDVDPPFSPDYKPHPSHTQGFTSPLLATDSVHIDPIAGPSVPESIGTAITCNPVLVPGKASHNPGKSAPSAIEIGATNFVSSDDLTPHMHTDESGETSQAPVAPLIFHHPDPVPDTIMSSSRPDPVGGPDALQDTTSSVSLSDPLRGDKQQDTVTPCTAPDISEIPSAVNSIQLIPTSSPAIVVSDSPSVPNLLPALSGGVTTAEHSSFVECAPIQPDHISHALRSPSSFLTTASSHDTHDLNPRIPMTVLHSDQMGSPAKDIVAATLQPEDQAEHDLDKL